MDSSILSWSETKPRMVHRACGGWLAVSPPGAFFRIGVTGATEAEAAESFELTKRRWAEIWLSEPHHGEGRLPASRG